MGLDQYLEIHYYLGTNDNELIDIINKQFGIGNAQKLVIEIGYWRKVYEIHEWFVKNCNFIDNGSEVEVTFEQLLKLKEWCEDKLKEKRDNEYQEFNDDLDYIITQYNHTINIINKIIKFETCNKIDNKISTSYYKYTANW